MGSSQHRRTGSARAFLTALVRDVRANTIAIMAMAVIPLAGMIGGAVDISRMYIVKTRLQHACDAGALAGRKTMGGGTWSYSNYAARGAAEKFFDANYNRNAYGARSVTRNFTENAGKVSGTASATLPMTLMRIFGRTTETLTVTCDADMRLPNTDVMFVLDTTGSMADPQPGDSVSKMQALKTAVKCFYEIVARLDTDAPCTTGTPSGGTGDQVQIRFGFVPYATNVNVGKLLKQDWMANSWSYQTRKLVSGGGAASTGPWSGESDWTYCAWVPGSSSTQEVEITQQTTWYGMQICKYRTRSIIAGGGPATWNYGYLSQDVSGLKKADGTWNDEIELDLNDGGNKRKIHWDGCIEERATVRATNYWPIPSGAKDLDIDLVPTADASTKWGPVLPGVIYTRKTPKNGNGNYYLPAVGPTTTDYGRDIYYACPVEAKKLQAWKDADDFDDYVDSLSPEGNTYHDIGLVWGARLLSPTGLFASENAYTSKGGEIERHLIFMTDGDACTGVDNYTAYGVAWFDRRQTDIGSVPTAGCTSNSYTLTEQVNKRTEALCSAIKNKNITLWVIAFGNLASSTETRLQNCATSSRYFKATNAAELQSTFKSIADQISQLRLTR